MLNDNPNISSVHNKITKFYQKRKKLKDIKIGEINYQHFFVSKYKNIEILTKCLIIYLNKSIRFTYFCEQAN